MRFSIYQESRQGARHSNQDRIGYVYTADSVLIVVCDGMGGHAHGEVAAQYVIEHIAKMFRQSAKPKLPDPQVFLHTAMIAAHAGLTQYARSQRYDDAPRTTCVACIIQSGRLWWGNIGDSRAHLVRDSSILERTVDHSYVQTLVDRGEISEDEALIHPERNKIYNCIGQPTLPKVDVSDEMLLMPGDVVLLCTDGLWGPVPRQLLASTLSRSDVSVSLSMLLDMAEAFSGRECDNLSGVALGWLDDSLDADAPLDRDSIYVVAESRTITDEDVSIAIDMIMGSIHHNGNY